MSVNIGKFYTTSPQTHIYSSGDGFVKVVFDAVDADIASGAFWNMTIDRFTLSAGIYHISWIVDAHNRDSVNQHHSHLGIWLNGPSICLNLKGSGDRGDNGDITLYVPNGTYYMAVDERFYDTAGIDINYAELTIDQLT